MQRLILCAMTLVALCVGVHAAEAAGKHALVVGIDRYANLEDRQQLHKARNDAQATADTLEALGFTVDVLLDTGRSDINRGLQAMLNRIEPGDTAAFYFAGHGVSIDGLNYLLPADIPAISGGQEEFLKSEAIRVDTVVDMLRNKGARLSLLVLDACRNNPFSDNRGRSIGSSRGLSLMAPPEGTLVLFSAGAGQEALDRLADDDPDPNSVFTRTLLPLLRQEGQELAQVAREVKLKVNELARSINHLQTPAVYNEVIGDVFLAGQGEQPELRRPGSADLAREAWESISATDSQAILNAFLQQFPDSTYAAFARARLNELGEPEQPTEPVAKLPTGVIVSYSTGAGGLAMDGDGDHSPYVQALSGRLLESGTTLASILGTVGHETAALTAGKQNPVVYDWTSAEFELVPPAGRTADPRPKYALLIGNSSYRHASQLKNPANDARLMAEKFERAGFETELVTDGDWSGMALAIDRLKRKATRHRDGAVVALFFAGNSVAKSGKQLLIPVDAPVGSAEEIERASFDLDTLIAADFGSRSLAMFFVDGCRDDPFASTPAKQ